MLRPINAPLAQLAEQVTLKANLCLEVQQLLRFKLPFRAEPILTSRVWARIGTSPLTFATRRSSIRDSPLKLLVSLVQASPLGRPTRSERT